jgi:glycosyltransferase involved in cell wall biosynthesis
MRFLLVTTFYPPASFGGDALFVRRLAVGLAGRGHRVEVAHNLDAFRLLAGREPEGAAPRDEGVTVHPLREPAGFLSLLFGHQTGRLPGRHPLREVLSREFDVIHFHNVSLMGGPGLLSLGRAVKLYTTHEYWLVCPTHILFKNGREACREPSCLPCTLRHRRPPQPWRTGGHLRRSLEHVDAFLAPSRFTAETHRRRGLDLPFVHLPLFVPPVDESSPPPAECGDGPYFLFTGRLESLKGLHTLLPLFAGEGGGRLLVAGSGSREDEFRRRTRGQARIVFLGAQPPPRVAALQRGAVAVVVPSLCPEVSPLAVMEAMSHGTPVIARDLGSLTELVGESGGGLLYRTEAELAGHLRRLAEDGPFRKMLGEQGRRFAREHWSVERHLDAYLDLIRDVVTGRGPRSPRPAAGKE